jgi:hypothetical protein
MAMTRYLRKKLGDHSLGKAAFTMPTTVYLALFTADPTDAGTLTNEASGTGYARVAITSLFGSFDLTTGIAVNSSDVDFGIPAGNWGLVSHAAVLDASTSGNMLYFEALPSARSVVTGGRRVMFTAGQMQIQIV